MASESERLPHVDEHATIVAAGRERTWDSLLHVVERTVSAAGAPRYARLVGCADTVASGPRPLAAGSTFPGFHVAVAEPGAELALVGSHRFSDYALVFRLEDAGDGKTRLWAETRAVFPGVKGAVYRALVIGTRMHVFFTRRMLSGVKRNAERA
jgi:hypothetical protein